MPWNVQTVFLSAAVATVAAAIALDSISRVRESRGRSRLGYFLIGSLVMGVGVWSVAVGGLWALQSPTAPRFGSTLMGLSLLSATLGSGLAFSIISRVDLGRFQLVLGGLAMGLGLSTAHSLAMASMTLPGGIHYDGTIFVLSIVSAVALSTAAFWVGFHLKRGQAKAFSGLRILSALLLGLAVSAMHFAGTLAPSLQAPGLAPASFFNLPVLGPTVGVYRLTDLLLGAIILYAVLLLLMNAKYNLERRFALESLGESETRFRSLADSAPFMVGVWDETGLATYFNQPWQTFTCRSVTDIAGQGWLLDIHPDDQPRCLAAFLAAFEGRIAWSEEFRMRRTDGSYRWIYANGGPRLTPHGHFSGYVASLLDITERKDIEIQLKNSEARFRQVSESNIIGIFFWSADGRILDANSAFLDLIGASRSALAAGALNVFSLTPAEYADQDDYGMTRARRGDHVTPYEKQMRHVRGHLVDVLVGYSFPEGTQGEGVAFVLDISARKRIEAENCTLASELEQRVADRTVALSKANDHLQSEISERLRVEADLQRNTVLLSSIIENIPAMVFLKEADTLRFELFNRAGEALTGFPREALLGKSDADFFPAEQAAFFIEKDRQTLAEGTCLDIPEESIRTASGEVRLLHTKKVPINNADGQPLYLLGISEDITEVKETQAQVRQLNEQLELQVLNLNSVNKELEAFSYSVSHDLRAPLRSINGFTRVILEDYAGVLDDTGKDYLSRVCKCTQDMAQLIEHLLRLSRFSRAEIHRVSVDLSRMVGEIADGLQTQEPTRSVMFKISEGLEVDADPILMKAVLQNLLDNAWKFTAGRDRACIEWGSERQQTSGRPVFYVRDNGAGFNMAHADRLFGAFHRLHDASEFPGTGIGLAMVQRIISRHGGHIWAEGAIDEGAAFFFTLG